MKIDGSKVLVTGANRGMGLDFAKELNRRGATVYLGMRKPESFSLLDEFHDSSKCHVLEIDMSSKEKIDHFLNTNQDLDIDILVNNAGLLTGGLIENQGVDEIYNMFQVNLVGLIHLTRALVPKMVAKGKGKIVNNSSVSAIMHFPCASTYAASKAGLMAFTNCLDSELKGTGVSTLTLFTPGIQTDMFDQLNDLYGKHVDTSEFTLITSSEYARRVCDHIEQDKNSYNPGGREGVGIFFAKYLPKLFKQASLKGFSRD